MNEQAGFEKFLRKLTRDGKMFEKGRPILIARAPGRLDVMGGIADYSGSLVLEMPIAEAAFAAVQPSNDDFIRVVSLGKGKFVRNEFEMPVQDLTVEGEPIGYDAARSYFRRSPSTRWAGYIVGVFVVLAKEKGIRISNGCRIMLDSQVPAGKGVSSSAAIEVATMMAIAAAFDLEIDAREIAILCQKVENLVVGAPCGIMDQMTSAAGSEGKLLAMVCQPAELRESVEIPGEIAFWGIDSGIKHSVGRGDYGSVRTGAFMGYRIIADVAGFAARTVADGRVEIDDPEWNGFLANLHPADFERRFATRLPRNIGGAEFLQRYGGITDPVTSVDPKLNYAVYHPTKHPVYESARVARFAELLREDPVDVGALGQMMYASHESYTACGLGSDGTDRIVEMVQESPNLFGAKITGGGSGGTVAILGRKGAEAEVQRIADEYAEETDRTPYVFSHSSMGAYQFGTHEMIF
jgi:galactokinase